MRIVTVCGCGLGTCFILKFTVEKVLGRLGVAAEVTPCDISSAALEKADIYIFLLGLQVEGEFSADARCIEIYDVIDEMEIEEKLKTCIYIKGI